MTTMVSDVARALQTVFTHTPEQAARDSGFVQRQSKLTGTIFVQSLTFGWLNNPEASLEELAQTAASLGVAISPQGLEQRFTPQAADCLRRVLSDAVQRIITADPVAIPILQRFPGGVCVLDSTALTLPAALADLWPGCGGTGDAGQAALRLQVQLNLRDGTLTGPFLQPGCQPDQNGVLQRAALPPGTLRLADLGFFSLETLLTLSQQEVYWLTRLQPGTVLFDASDRCWSLLDLLTKQATDTIDLPVALGVNQRLPARLLAVRVPSDVAAKRRERLREKARKKSRRQISPVQWALAEWTVYVTNVPEPMLSLAEALILGRCRWQIELLFKLWKSEGRIDESRSAKPWRVLCEVYAKLLGMVVQHWLLLVSCWKHADRSLVKASRTVRAHALELAVVLSHGHLVRRTLLVLQRCLSTGCRIGKRRAHPPNHQLLLNLAKAG